MGGGIAWRDHMWQGGRGGLRKRVVYMIVLINILNYNYLYTIINRNNPFIGGWSSFYDVIFVRGVSENVTQPDGGGGLQKGKILRDEFYERPLITSPKLQTAYQVLKKFYLLLQFDIILKVFELSWLKFQ